MALVRIITPRGVRSGGKLECRPEPFVVIRSTSFVRVPRRHFLGVEAGKGTGKSFNWFGRQKAKQTGNESSPKAEGDEPDTSSTAEETGKDADGPAEAVEPESTSSNGAVKADSVAAPAKEGANSGAMDSWGGGWDQDERTTGSVLGYFVMLLIFVSTIGLTTALFRTLGNLKNVRRAQEAVALNTAAGTQEKEGKGEPAEAPPEASQPSSSPHQTEAEQKSEANEQEAAPEQSPQEPGPQAKQPRDEGNDTAEAALLASSVEGGSEREARGAGMAPPSAQSQEETESASEAPKQPQFEILPEASRAHVSTLATASSQKPDSAQLQIVEGESGERGSSSQAEELPFTFEDIRDPPALEALPTAEDPIDLEASGDSRVDFLRTKSAIAIRASLAASQAAQRATACSSSASAAASKAASAAERAATASIAAQQAATRGAEEALREALARAREAVAESRAAEALATKSAGLSDGHLDAADAQAQISEQSAAAAAERRSSEEASADGQLSGHKQKAAETWRTVKLSANRRGKQLRAGAASAWRWLAAMGAAAWNWLKNHLSHRAS